MTNRLSIENLRLNIADTVNRAAFGRERVILERHGKAIAGIVPLDDVELLEAMEDREDLRRRCAGRKEKGGVTLEQLKSDLGL